MALGFSLAGPVYWMDLRHLPQRKTMPSFSPVLALPFNLQMKRTLAGKFPEKKRPWGQWSDQFPESGSRVRMASASGHVIGVLSRILSNGRLSLESFLQVPHFHLGRI